MLEFKDRGLFMNRFLKRWHDADPSLKLFLFGVLFLGINSGIVSGAFNNYLHDVQGLTSQQRGILEFPREFPGFALVFMTGALAFLSVERWAVLTGLFAGTGLLCLALLPPSYWQMIIWMLLWSIGTHLFMTVESVMGLRFAKKGGQGRRLGQISGATNFAAIIAAGIIWLAARYTVSPLLYKIVFLAAGICAFLAAFVFSRMKAQGENIVPKGEKFVYRKKYNIFYAMNILSGARKQIFMTFAPWVLVTIYGTAPDTMAMLLLIASFLGVVFRQIFGIVVDRYGERVMFMADGMILLLICSGFVFSTYVPLLFCLYILDNLMFSMRIARTTYMNKIAEKKSDITPSLSLGVTLDHAVSMTIPALGGILWAAFGYKSVFIVASMLSLITFLLAYLMKLPSAEASGRALTAQASAAAAASVSAPSASFHEEGKLGANAK